MPLESPQQKPADTCIRQFLGGDWLTKKEDWNPEVERAFGGDGYHGYQLDGFEAPIDGVIGGLAGDPGGQKYKPMGD